MRAMRLRESSAYLSERSTYLSHTRWPQYVRRVTHNTEMLTPTIDPGESNILFYELVGN